MDAARELRNHNCGTIPRSSTALFVGDMGAQQHLRQVPIPSIPQHAQGVPRNECFNLGGLRLLFKAYLLNNTYLLLLVELWNGAGMTKL